MSISINGVAFQRNDAHLCFDVPVLTAMQSDPVLGPRIPTGFYHATESADCKEIRFLVFQNVNFYYCTSIMKSVSDHRVWHIKKRVSVM